MAQWTPRTQADLTPTPPIPHLIQNVCRPTGSALIYGRTGIGKSRLLWQLACGWAAGHAVFGLTPCRPLRITFVEADMFQQDFESMIKEYQTLGISATPNLCWFARDDDAPMLVDGSFGLTLAAHNAKWDTDLTIFDAIPDMHIGDANDQRVAYQALRALQTAVNGRAYLGVLVRRKGSVLEAAEENETVDSMLGSQGWGRQASTIWQMTNVPSLVWVKHRLCPRPAPIILTNRNGVFSLKSSGVLDLIHTEASTGFTSALELTNRVLARPEYAALPLEQQYKERSVRNMISTLIAQGRITPSIAQSTKPS